jgi:adenosylcobinamide amidohydrolase
MNIPIHGIAVSQTDQIVHVKSESPLATLSSAIVGGGYNRTCHIINANVDKNFVTKNPKAWLRSLAKEMGINQSFIGLMTAVKLRKVRFTFFDSDGFGVGALITAGVGNATSAGVTPPYSYRPGTINTILLLDAHLTRAAMLNAVITATEAKCAVLKERNVLTPHGDPATGTSTDTVTVACTGKGPLQSYAGAVTTVGWLIARAVRHSLEESLSAE